MTALRKSFKRRGSATKKVCPHPEDLRIDARSMGHTDRWICGVCGAQLGNWEGEA